MREGLSRLWAVPVLVFFCVPLFIGLDNTDLQNDEAIYSFAVDSILETGDWLNPRSSPDVDIVFLEKPPLKFWIVALPISVGLLPHDEFGLRFWDAFFGAIAFLYVFAIGWRLGGWMCGVIAVLALFVQTELLFEHGLRNNNMEAPLVLSYCAGVYHFLAWASARTGVRRRWHAAAVGVYFFLGFMTKFVAALFLPAVLALTAISGPVRCRLREDARAWLWVCASVVIAVAPWFIYQLLTRGSEVWDIMVAGHVYARFTTGVDPTHLQPWDYYFRRLYVAVSTSGIAPLVAAGALLLTVDAIRLRRLEPIITLTWFAIPLALMSLGTLKLYHYAYPVLPPVALAAGYAPARVFRWATETVQRAGLDETLALKLRKRWRTVFAIISVAALCVALSTVLLGPIRLELGSILFRNSSVVRPLLVAVACGIVAARTTVGVRAALIVLVLTLLPLQQYVDAVDRLSRERRPLRTASDCLANVASTLRRQGQPSQVYALFPESHFWHPYFYYLRRVGPWEPVEQPPPDAVLAARLHDPAAQRPMLLADEWYQAYRRRVGEPYSAPMISFGNVLLVMPGPYAACSPEGRGGAS